MIIGTRTLLHCTTLLAIGALAVSGTLGGFFPPGRDCVADDVYTDEYGFMHIIYNCTNNVTNI